MEFVLNLCHVCLCISNCSSHPSLPSFLSWTTTYRWEAIGSQRKKKAGSQQEQLIWLELHRSSTTDQSTMVDTDIPYRFVGLAFAIIQLLSVYCRPNYVSVGLANLPSFPCCSCNHLCYGIRLTYYITTARGLARMVGI